MPTSATHKNDESFVPIDCPVCGLMMRDMRDCVQYFLSECCVECWVGFLEPLRKIKKDERYLPSKKEIQTYRKKLTHRDN